MGARWFGFPFVRIRYYVSNRLIAGGADPTGWRLPGPALEKTVIAIVAVHLEAAVTSHRVLICPDAGTAEATTRAVRGLLTHLGETGGRILCRPGIYRYPCDGIAGRSGGSPRVQYLSLRRRSTLHGEHGSVLAASPTHARFRQSELERMISQLSRFD